MKLIHYPLELDENLTTFEFVSEGPKGRIIKLIQFTLIEQNNLFNLAFGDKILMTGEIDDKVVTDNGDSEKVLATIIEALYEFSSNFPNAWVYATGSTPARTRLYRMGINKYYEAASADFEILGQTETDWERFRKGVDYRAFVVKRK